MDKFRKASPNERLYIQSQKLFSPLNIQIVFEGKGLLSCLALEAAVDQARQVCPGARLVYKKGTWYDSKKAISVKQMTDHEFDGYNFDDLKLSHSLDMKDQPPIEVLLLKGSKTFIIFRIFHGIMDGKGALLFIENVFRSLRNEPLIAIESNHSDLSFIKTLKYKKFKNLGRPHIKAFGHSLKQVTYDQVKSKRVTMLGDYKTLLPKIMKVLTDSFVDSKSKFMVPVSLRKKDDNLLTTSNMVLPIFIECHKEDTYKDIQERFIKKIVDDDYLNINNAQLGLLGLMPDWLMKTILKKYNHYCQSFNLHSTSGTVSYVGSYDLKDYSCDDFTCHTFYSIPLASPFSPVSIVCYKNDKAVELSISYYEGLVDDQELDKIIGDLRDEIKEVRAYNQMNMTDVKHSQDNLRVLLNDSMALHKSHIALIENDRKVTYKILDEESSRLSNHLLSRCTFEDKVYILIDRSIDFVTSVVACIKSGLLYVPLDLQDFEKLKTDIEIFPNDCLLVNDLSISFSNKHIKTINVSNYCQEDFFNESYIKNMVYRIYTSGSTGKPKGIDISHKNICNYLQWAKKTYQIDRTNTFAFFTSTGVDLSVTSYLLPLICGASIHVVSKHLNPLVIESMLSDESINTYKLTPTHLKLFKSLSLNIKLSHKLLVIGGELLTYETLKDNIFDQTCRFINEYGPTETTVGCIYYELDSFKSGSVAIGKPIDNTQIKLLDHNMKQVRQGEYGELFIGGHGVYNSESLYSIEGKTYYKTGDIAYLSDDNQYMFVKRIDNQIKYNGRRMNLNAIESVLNSHPHIQQSIVTYDDDKQDLIAFYISEKALDCQDLLHLFDLRKRPNKLVRIKSIPTLNNGKIDKEALKILAQNKKGEVDQSGIMSATEMKIANLYSQLLNLEVEVMEYDKAFILLGGDSLDYIRLTNRVIQEFEILDDKLMIDQMNENYFDLTVAKLSKLIDQNKAGYIKEI